MNSERKNILKSGATPRGRREKGELNKRTRLMKIIGQENYEQICRKHVETALYSENEDQRSNAQRFIMSLGEPKPAPIPHETYVKFPLFPMNSIEDIRENEKVIMKEVSEGELSMEQGERLMSMTEKLRKTYEATEIEKMVFEMDARMKEKGI